MMDQHVQDQDTPTDYDALHLESLATRMGFTVPCTARRIKLERVIKILQDALETNND